MFSCHFLVLSLAFLSLFYIFESTWLQKQMAKIRTHHSLCQNCIVLHIFSWVTVCLNTLLSKSCQGTSRENRNGLYSRLFFHYFSITAYVVTNQNIFPLGGQFDTSQARNKHLPRIHRHFLTHSGDSLLQILEKSCFLSNKVTPKNLSNIVRFGSPLS